MNRKQKMIVSVVGITIVLLALLGITYAYYLTRIQGNTNTNSISITTADLKIVYGDGNGLVTAENIMPGNQVTFKTTNGTTTTEKTFTVTNSGNTTVEGYGVSLDYAYIADTMPSIFERPEDFEVTLTCTTSKTGETCNGFTGDFNNESIMMTSNDIEVGETHSYSLSIYYNDPGVDQSNDMGKNLNLKVQIYGISETTDIEGTITGVDSTYAVRIESDPKISTIVNGKYSFKGVEIGTHTLTVLDKDGNEVDKEYIVVKSGIEVGISTTKATIDDNEVDATAITITDNQRVAKLTTKIESSVLSFDTSTSKIKFNPYNNLPNTLAYKIINNSQNGIEGSSVYIEPENLITKPGEASNNDEKILSYTQDDYGTSYYFRGAVNDNFINYSGMCWRIVRIQGDGTIKLVLANSMYECDSENYSLDENATNAYIGSTSYGGSNDGYYASSNIPSFLSSWITTSNLDTSKLENTQWCNDTSIISVTNTNENFISPYYGGFKRLYIEDDEGPSLKCDFTGESNSKSTIIESNIALLSADEVVFAGGSSTNNGTTWTYYLIANIGNNNWPWYTMTPMSLASAGCIYLFGVEMTGELTNANFWQDGYYIRPSIVLKKEVSFKVKNVSDELIGSKSNPYVIE